MRFVMGAFEEVDVVRGDQPESEVAGNVDESRAVASLLFDPVVGQFDEEVFFSEDVPIGGGILKSLRLLPCTQGHVDLTLKASAEGNQTPVVLGEELPVDARLVVKAVKMGGRADLDQIAVPFVISGQKCHMEGRIPAAVGGLFFLHGSGSNVDLAPDDRFDLRFLRGLIELHGSEEVPVVGQGDRRHSEIGGFAHELFHPDRPVQQRVLAVHMEMNEGNLGHQSNLKPPVPRGKHPRKIRFFSLQSLPTRAG